MFETNEDARRKISKAAVGLLLRHPFFGSLLYRHDVLISESVETAAVTLNRTILLNPEFVKKCSAPQLEFLLAHEVMHVVFAHIARRIRKLVYLFSHTARNCQPISDKVIDPH